MSTPVAKAVSSIESMTSRRCDIALILGSGLGAVGDELDNAYGIPYEEIEGFPEATTAGHAGRLLLGELCGQDVAVLQGRMHLYEGWRAADIAVPVRVLRRLGATQLIVTNAAGALNPGFRPGQIMLIEDHLNFTGTDPLIGRNDDAVGLRFPDMSRAYDPALRQLAETVLNEQGLDFRTGIYAGVTGPSLETSAERRFYRLAGADAIGMSALLTTTMPVMAPSLFMRLSRLLAVSSGS